MKTFLGSMCRVLCCTIATGVSLLSAGNAGAQTSQPARGACCVMTASGGVICGITTETRCTENSGQWSGTGSLCTNVACAQLPVGACCLPPEPNTALSPCQISTLAQCNQAGGVWRGPNSACAANACPPAGACCFVTDAGASVCLVLPRERCLAQGGKYAGNNVVCSEELCPPGVGACCVYSAAGTGECSILTRADCVAKKGVFKGFGSACETQACPDVTPRGRCCLPSGVCAVTTEERCKLNGGRFDGVALTCETDDYECGRACACDINTDGTVDDRDLRLFIDAYLRGHADINGDGVTNNDDLFDFITCWTNPPEHCARPAMGGCCISGVAGWLCTVTTRAECLASTGGQYLGDGVPCRSVQCPLPVGACCTLNNEGFICRVTTRAECGRGMWRGVDSTCDTNPCPVIAPNTPR